MRSLLLLLFLGSPWYASKHTTGKYYSLPVLQGIDVSHYQKRIDWDVVLGAHFLDFAFVKATEGADYRDSLFLRNWEALRRHGVRRGAYHFFRANGSGYRQAIHYLNFVDMAPGDLAPVLDVETTDGVTPEVMRREIRRWLETVSEQLQRKPIIYTNQKFYNRYLAGYFDEYPLWIARYSDKHPRVHHRFWDFWQYSNRGTVSGISEPVDLNMFVGTAAMLEQHCWYPALNATPGVAP